MDNGDEHSFVSSSEAIDTEQAPGADKENAADGESLVKWCQTMQERALRQELQTEKFGITRRERVYFRKMLGYDEKEKKKTLSDAGGFTIEALNLHQEFAGTQDDEDSLNQKDNKLGSLPSIFSQVGLVDDGLLHVEWRC